MRARLRELEVEPRRLDERARRRPGLRRAAWLEIDLAALRHNVGVIRSLAGPAAVAPVVKADAYGHGLHGTAEALARVSDGLCVATLDEAIDAARRPAGRAGAAALPGAAVGGSRGRRRPAIELTIMSAADLEHLQRVAPLDRPPVALHLCVETGLGRGGLTPAEVAAAVAVPRRQDPRFRLAGLWSHLARPGDAEVSARQVERFGRAEAALAAAGIRGPGPPPGRQRPPLQPRGAAARAGATRARRLRRARRRAARGRRERRRQPPASAPP